MNTRMRILAGLSSIAVFTACGSPEADTEPATASPTMAEAPRAEAAMDHSAHMSSALATLDGSGPWMVTASGGAHVTLSSTVAPLQAGDVDFGFSVHSPDGEARVVSVDLVSPTMPMHGVQRFAVEDGRARFTIPMEGVWTVYANLDSVGADAAEFTFAVSTGASPEQVHHEGGVH